MSKEYATVELTAATLEIFKKTKQQLVVVCLLNTKR